MLKRTWLLRGVVGLAVLVAALAGALSVRAFGPVTDWSVLAAAEPTATPTATATMTVTSTTTPTVTPTSTPTPEPTATPIPEPVAPPIPGPEVVGERWIDVDLSRQTATAMIGDVAIYTAFVTTGKEGWDTPQGTFYIEYRVESETMTSAAIGAEEYYVLEDVLYTQYFTNSGHALHLNYWRAAAVFGSTRTSHGCVGLRLADAEFFWRFAGPRTRVTIHGDGSGVPSI